MASVPSTTDSVTTEPPSVTQHSSDKGHGSEMIVYVGLPLIIAIFLALVALLLLLVYFVLRAKSKQRYSKVPRAEGRLTNLSNLPYPSIKPPSIKIDNVPEPDMTFTVAPQLRDPASTQRYPFIKHKRQQNKTIHGQKQEKGKQRKNGKKTNGRTATPTNDAEHNHRADSGTHSVSPPGLSPTGEAKGGARKSSVVSLSQFGERHTGVADAFMISAASKQVGRSSNSADKPPDIFLSLTYLKDKTMLIVNVERVVGLPPRDDGAEVDAYVRLFFIPRLPEMAQRKTSKTRTAKRELDPVFHEQIQYEAMSEEELINSTLHVQVLDYRAYGRHNIIGQAELPLGQVTLGEDKEPVVLQLHAPKVKSIIHLALTK